MPHGLGFVNGRPIHRRAGQFVRVNLVQRSPPSYFLLVFDVTFSASQRNGLLPVILDRWIVDDTGSAHRSLRF
jgi:hypothetical protein